MRKKPRVVYWNHGTSPYIVGRFNAVARYCNLQFEAWFTELTEPGRSWKVDPTEWEFRARMIPKRSCLGMRLHLPLPELREVQPDLLVSGYSRPSWVFGSFAASSMGTRTAFRVIPTSEVFFPRSRYKEKIKSFLFRAVDGVKVSGNDGAAFAEHYGMPRDRIVNVTQSIDVNHYRAAADLSASARAAERERLGLEGCAFVYVGRLLKGKGLEYLFEAYRQVRRRSPDVSLLIVGDGQDERLYRGLADGLPKVRFVGFVQSDALPKYYGLVDVMVFPTLGDGHGLVVEEAMAAGVPVISTEAAGDIRLRLPDGKAGYIVPPANADALAERMLRLAANRELRAGFAREAALTAQQFTHERYANDFERFVEATLSNPQRSTLQAAFARKIGWLTLTVANKSDALAPLISRSGEAASLAIPSV